VLICAYTERRWDELVAAVASVQQQQPAPLEVIIAVDHNPNLSAMARAHFANVVVIDSDQPTGLNGTRNAGMHVAHGEIVAFIDDDAIATPGWLERLVATFNIPGVQGAGGYIEPIWPTSQPRWFPDEFRWVVGCSYRGLPVRQAPIRNLIGCNMAYRRAAWVAIGGFRTGVGHVGGQPRGCDETEFCIRLRHRWPEQHTLLYVPEAVVRHHVSEERARRRYFWRRCRFEGGSKALIVRLVGADAGLASERTHALRTLPLGVLRGIRDVVVRADLAGLDRAWMITSGLAMTALAYLAGRISGDRDLPTASGRHSPRSAPVATIV
jgi:glycosyltransferase involved in cell wall biosynthesis